MENSSNVFRGWESISIPSNSSYKWTRRIGPTPTLGTGPSEAYDGKVVTGSLYILERRLIEINITFKKILCVIIPRGGVEDTGLEAKAKDTKKFRGQRQECSRPRPRTKDTNASVLKKRKKGLQNFFSGDLQKKNGSRKNFFSQSTKF